MNAPTHVAIAVVKHQARWLVGKRPAGRPLAGYWEFPGGKVLPAEIPAAAAQRECQEETGLVVRIDAQLAEYVHHYQHATLMLSFFLCHPTVNTPLPNQPFRFVSSQQLRQLRFPPANDAVLRQILDSSR